MRALPTKNCICRMIAICSFAAITSTHAIAAEDVPKAELSIITSSSECKLRVKQEGEKDKILSPKIPGPCKFTRTQDTQEIIVFDFEPAFAFMVTHGDKSAHIYYYTRDKSFYTLDMGTVDMGTVGYADRLFKSDRTLIEWDKLYAYPVGQAMFKDPVDFEEFKTHDKKTYYFIDDISQIAELEY